VPDVAPSASGRQTSRAAIDRVNAASRARQSRDRRFDELRMALIDRPRDLDRQVVCCGHAIQNRNHGIGQIFAVGAAEARKGWRLPGMRRQSQHIADHGAAIDQFNEFRSADLPVHRGQLIGDFVAAEVLEAERAIFFSRTTTVSFDVRWPISALAMSPPPHCRRANSSAAARQQIFWKRAR
jgi:hypothetical protein